MIKMIRDTIRIGKERYIGSNVDIVGGDLYIDGKLIHSIENKKLEIVIESGAIIHSIKADQGLSIRGNVQGQITGTSINCDDVHGNITAKTVNCGNVLGDIKAEGTVNCDKVSGSVTAKIVNS